MASRIAVSLVLLLALSLATLACAATTERISVSGAGAEADGGTDGAASLSADGRYVAFFDWASNLVENDTNSMWDVFVRDRQTDTISRVSISSAGEQGDGYSVATTISGDGRYVAFDSDATNLVLDDTNGARDVFLHDRQSGTTTRVSLATSGEQADAASGGAAISADGGSVLFLSGAANLVAGDTNGREDLFVRDLDAGATERVNISSAGLQADDESSGWAISGDGRYVAFSSYATNLVPDDSNGSSDVFVRDREAGTTTRVSLATSGDQGNNGSYWSAISADGRFVAFTSDATNLVPDDTNGTADVFVRDLLEGTTERVSLSTEGAQGDNASYNAVLSADGRFVAFVSYADGLVHDDSNGMSDILVRDRTAGVTTRASLTFTGAGSSGESGNPAISADGRFVSFTSFASDLVPDDTNDQMDVFLRDRQTFSDVPVTLWAFYQIDDCLARHIVGGYDDGTYQPAGEVTRDQMAVYIARALSGGIGSIPPGPAEATFDDVPIDNWAYDAVEYCCDQNVVQGYTPTTYGPTDPVTRDQMAVFVARAIVAPAGEAAFDDYIPTAPRNFPDVDSGFWAYKHIEYCVENSVVNGYDDGYYHPDLVVTRDQMAVYIARTVNHF